MLGDVLNTQELLTLATAIEGHPDNVAPALLGGLTSSVFEDGKVYSVKRNVDESLCFAAIVPDYKVRALLVRPSLCPVRRTVMAWRGRAEILFQAGKRSGAAGA